MATSKLQRYVSRQLSINFGQYIIKENIRPDWLITPDGERLELDFMIDELSIAIEVQGKQHYTYVPFFHGKYENYQKRLKLDQFKRDTCLRHGIKLFEIDSKQDVVDLINSILKLIPIESRMPSLADFRISEKLKKMIKQRNRYLRILKRNPSLNHVKEYLTQTENKIKEMNGHTLEKYKRDSEKFSTLINKIDDTEGHFTQV